MKERRKMKLALSVSARFRSYYLHYVFSEPEQCCPLLQELTKRLLKSCSQFRKSAKSHINCERDGLALGGNLGPIGSTFLCNQTCHCSALRLCNPHANYMYLKQVSHPLSSMVLSIKS